MEKTIDVDVDDVIRNDLSDALMGTVKLIMMQHPDHPFAQQIMSFIGLIGAAIVHEDAGPFNELYMTMRNFIHSPVGHQLIEGGHIQVITSPQDAA